VVQVLAGAVFALGVGASEARSERAAGQITISMLAGTGAQPSFEVLIANFERAYPNITVSATYAPSGTVFDELEKTELAAGNAPDILNTTPGCGTPISVCVLAGAGYLAPIRDARWTKWSLPLVISLSKEGQGLFTFLTTVGPGGVFTNNDLFKRLDLKVPQTFPQLLELCRQATADGTVALNFGTDNQEFDWLIMDLATANVYGKDKHWAAERKAGTVTFEGTPGWYETLQEVIDMNDAGCFEPGATGTAQAQAIAEFAQGQGLMIALTSGQKGALDADSPQFSYSFHPFPGGTSRDQTRTQVNMGTGLSVNAHSSPANQAAAQTFIDFVARPAQDALYAKIKGSITQYQFLHAQVQPFMSSFAPIFADHEYVMNPDQTWWNPNVLLTLQQDEVGLLTGQSTVDGILSALDAAWQQGPS